MFLCELIGIKGQLGDFERHVTSEEGFFFVIVGISFAIWLTDRIHRWSC